MVKKWVFLDTFLTHFWSKSGPIFETPFLQKRLILYNVCDKKWLRSCPKSGPKSGDKKLIQLIFRKLAILSFCKKWKIHFFGPLFCPIFGPLFDMVLHHTLYKNRRFCEKVGPDFDQKVDQKVVKIDDQMINPSRPVMAKFHSCIFWFLPMSPYVITQKLVQNMNGFLSKMSQNWCYKTHFSTSYG